METAKDYFNESANKWDKPMRVALARAVAEAITNNVRLSKTMTAMEFGCGTGLIAMALAPLVKSVLAVDMSENMLAVLEDKIARTGARNISTRQLDFSRDELPVERFDLIFSSMALHHIKDVDGLTARFHSLLNPGGIVALADLDTEDGGFHGDIPDVFHLGFDREELRSLLEKNGFTDVCATTAYVMKKENALTGKQAEFPVFLMTAKSKSVN